MFTSLFNKLEPSHCILTVNQRLSLSIRRDYQQWQQQQGNLTWESLHVLPLSSWITDSWQHYHHSNTQLLSPLQERQLWLNIVQNDQRFALIQPNQTALKAQQAWQTLNDWNLSLEDIEPYANQEVATFIQWARVFLQQCQQQQWTPSATVVADLITDIDKIPLPDTIILIGFDEHTPAQQQLIDTLAQHTHVEPFHQTITEPITQRIALNDCNDEIATMARWAKQQWLDDPTQRIGCIIPNLNALRQRILHAFLETFDLAHLVPNENNPKLPFNFSAGQSLGSYTMMHDAIQFIVLLQQRRQCSLTQLRQWLYSPYFQCDDSDAECAATVDTKLSQQGKATLPGTMILEHLAAIKAIYPNSTYLQRWRQLQNCQIPNKQSPSQWASWIAQQLQQAGWPGGRQIVSLEYQLMDRLKHTLSEMQTLDTITPNISLKEAMAHLKDTINNTPFQPEGSEAPIQILGVLEASGYQFDQQWIMNLSDETWPAAAQANPFLPNNIQQQHRMPHADGQRELDFARTMTQRLLSSSKQTYVSYPQQEAERSLNPSPLILSLPQIPTDTLKLADKAIDQALVPSTLHPLDDFQAPPLSANEQPRGGTWILKQQAHCPFKAFASTRLQATTTPDTHIGFSAAQSGTLVHVALEWLWQQLNDSTTLASLSEEQLVELISQSFDQACRNSGVAHNQQPGFIALEKQRISDLLYQWLTLEKKRPPFTVIAEEQQHTMQWQQLTFNISIDRIDQLANGDHIIIDYKTNETNINSWFQDRLEEPQLPTYYLANQNNNMAVGGIGFAQLKAGKLGFKGVLHESYSNNNDNIAGFTPVNQLRNNASSWQQCQQQWQQSLQQLTNEFCSGHAAVEPLNNTTCRYCDLQPLCRVFEK